MAPQARAGRIYRSSHFARLLQTAAWICVTCSQISSSAWCLYMLGETLCRVAAKQKVRLT